MPRGYHGLWARVAISTNYRAIPAILKLYVYSGIRLATGCRIKVEDFQLEEGEATVRIGGKRRTIGLNTFSAEAIEEYIRKAG